MTAIPPCPTCGTEYAGHSAEARLARVVAQRDKARQEAADFWRWIARLWIEKR